jgi:indole-3-glycerol phosphate synthase
MPTPDRLRQILDTKRQEIERLRPKAALLRAAAAERNDFRSLHAALTACPDSLAVIAEVKKASPSAGVISSSFDPVAVARGYEAAGADAISVLTDEVYFQGHLSHLSQVRREVSLPVLRKDFILDEIQIHEAAVAGADAVLLIVAALEQSRLVDLLDVATAFQLDALVEVHDLAELERALDCEARIIGINNRNLHTFTVDLRTTERLSQELPPDVVLISESGIRSGADAAKVRSWGADAILVGESLMRCEDVGGLLASFKASAAASASPS